MSKKIKFLVALLCTMVMTAEAAFALTGTINISGQKTDLDDCEFDWLLEEDFDERADGAYPSSFNTGGNYYDGNPRIIKANGGIQDHQGYVYAQDGCLLVAFGDTWKTPEMIHFQMDIRVPNYGKAGGVYLKPIFNDNKISDANLRFQDFAGFSWSKANNNEYQTLHVEFYPAAGGATWAACWVGDDRSASTAYWYQNCGKNASASYDNISGIKLVTGNAGTTFIDNIKFGCRRMYYHSDFNEASDFAQKSTLSKWYLSDSPGNGKPGGYVGGPMADFSAYKNDEESYDGSCLEASGNFGLQFAVGTNITNTKPTQVHFAMKRDANTTPGITWGRDTSLLDSIKLYNLDAFIEAAPVDEWVYYTLKFTPASNNATASVDCTWKTADGRSANKLIESVTWGGAVDSFKLYSTDSSSTGKVYIDDVAFEVCSIYNNKTTYTHAKSFNYEPSQFKGTVVNDNQENAKATLIVAYYDKGTGKLLSTELKNIDIASADASKSASIRFSSDDLVEVKAFLFNADTLEPLAEAEGVTVEKKVYPASGILVEKELRESNTGCNVEYSRWYDEPTGYHLIEKRVSTAESDFYTGAMQRESSNNGKTFSDWKDVYKADFEELQNGDEIAYYGFDPNIYDKTSKNFVTCGLMRYCIGDHESAYQKEYTDGVLGYSDHAYLVYKTPDGVTHKQHIKYEEGADYEDGDPRDDAYFKKNRAYFSRVEFASNGDLLMSIGADVRACCRILGVDVNKVFPSCPDIMMGTILVRAHWNEQTQQYDMTFSEPVVISDVQSSRGVCEPCVSQLKSGRIVIVFRGSNVIQASYNTRVNSATPGFKWYCYSDDGGKTFTTVMPWNFDTREVVYSSATISYFFRSSKNGKLYWIGNITDPTKTDGNFPRYPLYICQVNDEYGYLMKDTLTVIDTKQAGESDNVQLSNFGMLENRATKQLEIRLSKLGITSSSNQYDKTENWTYYIDFE